MKADSVRAIIAGLNDARARYPIVGGLAVVAHGYVRYTADDDLVIALGCGERPSIHGGVGKPRLSSTHPGEL